MSDQDADQETITVADVSAGPGGANEAEAGTPVSVPVVELLTGRGFITGKSGSGKSNTASVVVEKLLDNNFPVLIVDTDGEYYGLKEEYELLHAGADDECDIVVSAEHAEKLASLALEQNVPIILDVSGYLDDSDAKELLLEVTKQLFAKEKKLKKPFLMLVEECHEYMPEGGGLDETGKMLIKVGKRGRKHGLGIVGISQRPADVKKDYITQCDWLCWHRLTWNNDTQVVGRILGSAYADAIEDMGDGEAFLMTDWAEEIRRVQFRRKQTFDAGATPGLEDFERPDLKSVSGDLVSDLQSISDEQASRESELADLRQELDQKRQRIQELERELEEARDMSRMADKFAQALLQKAEAPYRGGGQDAHTGVEEAQAFATDAARDGHPGDDESAGPPRPERKTSDARALETEGPTPSPVPNAMAPQADTEASEEAAEPSGHPGPTRAESPRVDSSNRDAESDADRTDDGDAAVAERSDPEQAADDGRAITDDQRDLYEYGRVDPADGQEPRDAESADETQTPAPARADESAPAAGADAAEADGGATAQSNGSPTGPDAPLDQLASGPALSSQRAVVRGFTTAIDHFDEVTVGMLARYASQGTAEPMAAHAAAGGSTDRRYAYARNRALRRAGLVEHIQAGRYRYRLPDLVRTALDDPGDAVVAETVEAIETQAGLHGTERSTGSGKDGAADE